MKPYPDRWFVPRSRSDCLGSILTMCLAVVGVFVGSVQAVQITYTNTLPNTQVSWNTGITVPQFDSRTLGALTGVRIVLSGTARAIVYAENVTSSPLTASVATSFRFDLGMKTPDQSYLLGQAVASGTFVDDLTMGVAVKQDFQGADTASATHLLQFSQDTYWNQAPTLSLFRGTGLLVLPCECRGGFVSGDGGPGVVVGFNTSSDLQVMVVYEFIPFAYDPKLSLTQTADQATVALGEPETFRFGLWNYTGATVTDVRVTDDNGTPTDSSDDFIAGSLPSLAGNYGTTFVISRPLPVRLEITANSQTMDVGTLYAEFLANGDLSVKFRQSRNIGDNTYGANAVGYPKGHKFGDISGSDKAQFRIRDRKGKIVLEFAVDYLSASSGFPSGYGSLGVSGGDGKMIIGSGSAIKSATSTLSQNLNQSAAYYGYKLNSPLADPNWQYAVGYDVVVAGTAFGPNGFGELQVVKVHNSPSKIGYNDIAPVAVASCFVNSAVATARLPGLIGSGEAAVNVCVQPPCTSGYSAMTKDFNGTAIAAGRTIWFNSVVKLNGRSASQAATLRFDEAAIAFTLNGVPVTVDVPAATLIFDAAATAASTTWDATTQTWTTRVPVKFTGNVFLSGVGYRVPANITTSVKDVSWTGRFAQTLLPGVVPEWKWAASVYTSWGATPAAVGVKPIDASTLNPYANSDAAGTPEAYKPYVIGGATGGGGSNYTGGYSGIAKVTAPCTL